MRLSFGSWAFTRGPFEGNPVSLHATLHKLEDEGYQGIELGAVAPHPTLESHATKQKREQVRKEVADHGLAFSGMAPNLREHKLASVDDSGPYVAAFARHVMFAEDLGIPAIRVDTVEPLAGLTGVDPKRMFDRIVKGYGLCAKIAADRGIRVCWEFEHTFRCTPRMKSSRWSMPFALPAIRTSACSSTPAMPTSAHRARSRMGRATATASAGICRSAPAGSTSRSCCRCCGKPVTGGRWICTTAPRPGTR